MSIRWCPMGLLLVPSIVVAQAPDGKALYEASCKMCHGAAGVPTAPMKKLMETIPTFDSAFIATRSDDSVVKVLLGGTKRMTSYKGKLSPEQLTAVAGYVRELALKPRAPGSL